jgi:hypothetical protein
VIDAEDVRSHCDRDGLRGVDSGFSLPSPRLERSDRGIRDPTEGTCALRGCDPKKVLVGAAEVIDRIQRMQG